MPTLLAPDHGELGDWLAHSEEPMVEALLARQRWIYIRDAALAALYGQVVDPSLRQVISAPEAYVDRAAQMVGALSDWIAEHGGPEADVLQ